MIRLGFNAQPKAILFLFKNPEKINIKVKATMYERRAICSIWHTGRYIYIIASGLFLFALLLDLTLLVYFSRDYLLGRGYGRDPRTLRSRSKLWLAVIIRWSDN